MSRLSTRSFRSSTVRQRPSVFTWYSAVKCSANKPYEHRCPRAVFEQIAHAAEELGEQGFTLESLLEYERQAGRDVTFTNVAVVLAFLRERGILDVRYRRNFAVTDAVHLDAMTEYWALAENG